MARLLGGRRRQPRLVLVDALVHLIRVHRLEVAGFQHSLGIVGMDVDAVLRALEHSTHLFLVLARVQPDDFLVRLSLVCGNAFFHIRLGHLVPLVGVQVDLVAGVGLVVAAIVGSLEHLAHDLLVVAGPQTNHRRSRAHLGLAQRLREFLNLLVLGGELLTQQGVLLGAAQQAGCCVRDVVCGMRDAGCVAAVLAGTSLVAACAVAGSLGAVLSGSSLATAHVALVLALGSIVRSRASRGAVLESNDKGW